MLTSAPTNRVRRTVIQIDKHVGESSARSTKQFPNG
jgi:hypothetical protein